MPKAPTFQEMQETVCLKSNGLWTLELCSWKGKSALYKCTCSHHAPFEKSWSSLRLGYGCPECGKQRQVDSVTKYTEEEDSYIIANHTMSAEFLAKELGRTAKSIAKRRSILNLPKKTRADSAQTKIATIQRVGLERREQLRGIVEDELFNYPASPSVALQQGHTYYFTGEECERGHISARYASNRNCVECCVQDSAGRAGSETRKAYIREYQKRPENAEKRRISQKKRYKENVQWRTRLVLSSRINTALARSKNSKDKPTVEYIGCSWEQFEDWITQNLEDGMTPDNYGNKQLNRWWEYGHVRPIASFDLADPAQHDAAFNWRNVRPQWNDDNRQQWYYYSEADEKAWELMMLALGYEGDLFLKFSPPS